MSHPPDRTHAFVAGLGEAGRRIDLARGQVLFRRGETVREIFVLLDGALRLERTTAGGGAAVVHRVKPGESFAEASLFSEVYHCDAVATAASRVAAYRRDVVLAGLDATSPLARTLLATLAGRCRDLRTLLELRSVRSAEERICGYLALELDGGVGLSHTAIAAELGLTREAFSRAVGRLERAGRVERRGPRLVLRPA